MEFMAACGGCLSKQQCPLWAKSGQTRAQFDCPLSAITRPSFISSAMRQDDRLRQDLAFSCRRLIVASHLEEPIKILSYGGKETTNQGAVQWLRQSHTEHCHRLIIVRSFARRWPHL